MFEDMQGRVCIVTGAGKGIGEQIALKFAQAGVKVVANSASGSAQKVVDAIKAAGGEAAFFQGDISDEETVKNMVQFAIDT